MWRSAMDTSPWRSSWMVQSIRSFRPNSSVGYGRKSLFYRNLLRGQGCRRLWQALLPRVVNHCRWEIEHHRHCVEPGEALPDFFSVQQRVLELNVHAAWSQSTADGPHQFQDMLLSQGAQRNAGYDKVRGREPTPRDLLQQMLGSIPDHFYAPSQACRGQRPSNVLG